MDRQLALTNKLLAYVTGCTIQDCLSIECVFRLHRMHEMQSIVADGRGVCLSVCPFASLSVTWLCSASLCKNGWTDQDPVWDERSWGPKEHCVRRGSSPPHSEARGCSLRQITLAFCLLLAFLPPGFDVTLVTVTWLLYLSLQLKHRKYAARYTSDAA